MSTTGAYHKEDNKGMIKVRNHRHARTESRGILSGDAHKTPSRMTRRLSLTLKVSLHRKEADDFGSKNLKRYLVLLY